MKYPRQALVAQMYFDMKVVNAKIESTMLGIEDHGIFTFMIHLDYGGSGQGFGGYALGGEYTDKLIRRVLKVVGVEKWEDLKGKYVRVNVPESGGIIHSIGNLLTEEWLDPQNP